MQVGTNKHHNTHLHGLHSIPPCLGTLHAFGLLWLGFKIGPKLVGGWILSLLLCTSSSRRAIPPSKYVPHPGWMCYLEFGRKKFVLANILHGFELGGQMSVGPLS